VNLVGLLDRQARERPDAVAIVDKQRTVTFAGLADESLRCAAALAEEGLRSGDVVLVFCPMGVALYSTLVGILRLGLVAMFVDPSSGRAHIDRCCGMVGPRAFLGTGRAQIHRFVSSSIRRIPIHLRIARVWARPGLPSGFVEPCGHDAPALVTFTTGSTGEPKAALRTHGFLLAQHRAVCETLGLSGGDIDLTALPMFVLANLAAGVTSVIPDADLRRPGAVDPRPVLRQIQHHQPTRIVASPAFLDRIAAHCVTSGEMLGTVSRVFTGGGPVFPSLLDRMATVAPQARISGVYGSTEAEPIAIVDRQEIGMAERESIRCGRGLLAGRPVASITLRILPDRFSDASFSEEEFARAVMPAGEPGEIVVSGDHVLDGYLGGRGDQETKFVVDGRRWHRTGDCGYLDESGRLWLLGRSAAVVADAHGCVYPFSVEAAAEDHPGVVRAALVRGKGGRILAVQRAPDARGELRSMLASALDWAGIDEIRFVTRIPVDPRHNAKVDYAHLRRQLNG
jgi:acyl-CoA synthetase (AMP-forming)/AMP-acid ligase II